MQDLIETEQQGLYQTANLTDNLEDEDAKILLSWASKQVAVIAEQGDNFESNCKTLRKLMKDINYLIGNAEDLDSDGKLEELNRLYASATDLAYPTREDAMEALAEKLDGASPADMLNMILGWIEDQSDADNGQASDLPAEAIDLAENDVPDELDLATADDNSDNEDNTDNTASLDDDDNDY